MGRPLCLLVLAASVWAAATATASGDPRGIERSLAHPSGAERPSMLWWWPGAAVSDGGTASQIAAMKRAGFGATVHDAVASMLALPNVRQVASAEEVGEALASLGVTPDAAWDRPVLVRAAPRRTAGGDWWSLFNDASRAVRFDASLATRGKPYRVDLWDDRASPVAGYRQAGPVLRVPLALGPEEATVLVVDRSSPSPPDRSVVRANDGGSLEIGPWRLHVATFAPGGGRSVDLALPRLRDSQDIPALRNVAGTGTYEARFAMPASWLTARRGVDLTVGRADGASRIAINGRRVTASTIRLVGDRYPVQHLLRAGANTITVQVATPPLNALRGLGLRGEPGYAGFAGQPPVAAGLRGSVRLMPYRVTLRR